MSFLMREVGTPSVWLRQFEPSERTHRGSPGYPQSMI
jgi:hypothetical protein